MITLRFYSLQTGRTSRTRETISHEEFCNGFYSLQTGRTSRISSPKFNVPAIYKFLFPSNGKDFQNPRRELLHQRNACFYSLQTGRTSRTREILTEMIVQNNCFYSLQTGRTSRTIMIIVGIAALALVSIPFKREGLPELPSGLADTHVYSFYSLQTGRTSRTLTTTWSVRMVATVSIPFKREGLPERVIGNDLTPEESLKFLFPSNGKDFQNHFYKFRSMKF